MKNGSDAIACEPRATVETLVAAAEQLRREGRAELAATLCLAAARSEPRADRLHRTWGLALVAAGDPDGAVGHLARWGCEGCGAWEHVRAELVAVCGPSRADELSRSARHLAEADGARGAGRAMRTRRSRVFVAPGLASRRRALVRALAHADFEVVECGRKEGVTDALLRALPLELVILPIHASVATQVRELRSRCGLAGLPILGALAGGMAMERLEELRGLGLAGVVEGKATPEQLRFRVQQILGRFGAERRAQARVAVELEVVVDAGGVASHEHADSLSAGGLRIRCIRMLEINQAIRVRFRPEPEGDWIDASARVVNALPPVSEGERRAFGVFFPDLADSDRMRLEDFVARQLAAACSVDSTRALRIAG
jgi:hypothetical protein